MLLLAFDTATPAVTVALHDGERVLAERTTVDARRQGELLSPHIAEVLAAAGVTPADLGLVAVGVGPGPFTGLRVGVVTALVIGEALGIDVVGVCSLDVLAAEAVSSGAVHDSFLVTTDARRREVHYAAYDVVDGRAIRADGPAVAAPADVERRDRPVVGRGADLYAEVLGPRVGPVDPSAAVLASYAVAERTAGRALLDAVPLYLRRPDAVVPGPPKPVRS
ncbi:MAG: tRNA (adenosine(37)-N6)-threonylcarbamoyltransferase complex dimerization subunit type 1 TsaB [Actinomycetales bacterium]